MAVVFGDGTWYISTKEQEQMPRTPYVGFEKRRSRLREILFTAFDTDISPGWAELSLK